MSDSFVQVPPDSNGKQIDVSQLSINGQNVQRQRIIIGDNTGTASYATCIGTTPVGTEGALVVRNIPSGIQNVSLSSLPAISLAAGTTIIINNVPAYVSASRGPSITVVSTSATVALIGTPSAGNCIYLTKIACTNGGSLLTRGDVYAGSSTSSPICQMYMAASGGGFTMDYNPPIKVLSGTAVNARVKPNASQVIFNVHFYVAPK